MLGQRILTAVVLLAVLVPALMASTTWPFEALMLALIAAAAWEWARLNGQPQTVAVAMALALGLVGAAVPWTQVSQTPLLWWIGAALWTVGGALALKGGPAAWPRVPGMVRLAIGFAALLLAWVAIARARQMGVNFILSLLCIVWAADICAYAAGRTFGRHKLAPSISPGKSWEGVAGGVLGVCLLALAWTLWIDTSMAVDAPSVFTELRLRGGWIALLFGVLALTAISVVGDLFESLAKRAAGAKDSSRLLPGHGGVLDRIDAQLPVLPLAFALLSVL
jgi:phosphatidate cytidylyltransferase